MTRERTTPLMRDIPLPHQSALNEAVDRANTFPKARGFLLLDMDDVLFDTRPRIHAELSRILRRCNPAASIPSLDDARRGLRKSFEPLFDPSDPSVYAAINKRIIARPAIYRNAPLMNKNLPEILRKLADSGFVPIMCLSARNENVMDLSREELNRLGLPDLPVYAMHLGNEAIAGMKTEVIQKISKQLPGKKIFMIDDQEELILKLHDLQNPNIIGVLYDTPRFQTQGETWDTIPALLDEYTK